METALNVNILSYYWLSASSFHTFKSIPMYVYVCVCVYLYLKRVFEVICRFFPFFFFFWFSFLFQLSFVRISINFSKLTLYEHMCATFCWYMCRQVFPFLIYYCAVVAVVIITHSMAMCVCVCVRVLFNKQVLIEKQHVWVYMCDFFYWF